MTSTNSNLLNGNRDLAGILKKDPKLTIPDYVVIDITNKCNCNCNACWTYSPLLGTKRAGKEWINQELPFDKVKSIIDELEVLGTREIRLTGGGEPLLHKDFIPIVKYIKHKKLTCSVTTNGTLLTDKIVDLLIQTGLDVLTVSIWAGDSKTFARTHPNKTPEVFENIARNLHYLKSCEGHKPMLVIANVVSNSNYDNIDLMIDFALDVGANEVYFALVDPIENATDSLLLNEKQREYVIERITFHNEKFKNTDYFRIDCADIALKRLKSQRCNFGEYDYDTINSVPCYAGWYFARILADGNISPCCRGVKVPIGNIYKDSFANIWSGAKANSFRKMALNANKLSKTFEEIGCKKTCDNFPHNQWIHKRINSLTKGQKEIIISSEI